MTDDLRTRAEAVAKRVWPDRPDADRITYPHAALQHYRQGAFVQGALWHAAQQPTREVYSVQHWEDGDGIRSGWVTGYGCFTHSRADAEAQLVHDRRTHPTASFRLAVAEITDWRDVPTNGAGS